MTFRHVPRVRRTVEPEWLDHLPPDDPAAEQSRRDLRWINRRLGARSWFEQQLVTHAPRGARTLEIGAGDGELARVLRAAGHEVTALDRVPEPLGWPATWHACDVFQFAGWSSYPVVIANLLLHHFTFEQLAVLGARLQAHARVLLFSEPARRRRYQWLFALACRMERAHAITRHDGHVSIAAGFLGNELPHALGLAVPEWQWHIHVTGLGMYRIVATRR